jgi:uncharacterized protein DUF1844
MSNEQTSTEPQMEGSGEEMLSALFAQLVMQQANMAMMLLGKVAHPETGKVIKDVEGARLFIDQLEMLEVKTKGNLTKEESSLLKQSLMSLRLGFVEAVESPKPQAEAQANEPLKTAAPAAEASATEQEEHRKKFSKKY